MTLTSTTRLGIDVGGTNTDAVLVDEHGRVLAKSKQGTTPDVTTGIIAALRDVIEHHGSSYPIAYAMLGTTHCTNAVVERRGLVPVAVLRIGAPASTAIPPFTDWPPDLRAAVDGRVAIVRGGFEFDGREIVPLDEPAIERFAETLEPGRAVALVSIFSPVTDAHERRAAAIIRTVAGAGTVLSLSSEIGTVGLLERENATILNAALTDVARRATDGFRQAILALGLKARCYLTQNDGTLMDWDYARRYPIFTIASGPTNSLRGALYLSGAANAVVVDVGGTTTDVGALSQGYPRESAVAVEIGGVRTNFRMPDLVSVGLGGGSLVRVADGRVQVGPDSVGYALTTKALIFGGESLTLSDAAVRAGLTRFGDPKRLAGLNRDVVDEALTNTHQRIAEAVDRMKTSVDAVTVVAVGGGAFLVPDRLPGASRVLRPADSDVANAIGAAIGEASGEVDRVYSLDTIDRHDALRAAESEAVRKAVAAGSDPARTRIVDREEMPLAYLPGSATRIRIKAAGPLRGMALEARERSAQSGEGEK